MVPTLLLAAGRSSRMLGGDKLLEEVGGSPLLTVLCHRALAAGPVFVTLPARADHPRRAAVPDGINSVPVDGQMSDSIRAGLHALPADATGVIILPADMPDITSEDLAALKAAVTPDVQVVRATTEDGKPGHPIYFARATFPAFDALEGDRGAFRVCSAFEDSTTYVPLKGQRARLDLDTPEEWKAYRAGLKP